MTAILKADGTRRTREWDERRALNHHLAGLIAYATHSPKKMPKFTPTETAPKARDPQADLDKARAYLMGLAKRGKRKGAALA